MVQVEFCMVLPPPQSPSASASASTQPCFSPFHPPSTLPPSPPCLAASPPGRRQHRVYGRPPHLPNTLSSLPNSHA